MDESTIRSYYRALVEEKGQEPIMAMVNARFMVEVELLEAHGAHLEEDDYDLLLEASALRSKIRRFGRSASVAPLVLNDQKSLEDYDQIIRSFLRLLQFLRDHYDEVTALPTLGPDLSPKVIGQVIMAMERVRDRGMEIRNVSERGLPAILLGFDPSLYRNQMMIGFAVHFVYAAILGLDVEVRIQEERQPLIEALQSEFNRAMQFARVMQEMMRECELPEVVH